MSEENLEVVRRLYDHFLGGASHAYRRGEIPEADLSVLHPDIDWDLSEAGLPDTGSGRYQGIEGVREFWQSFLEAWQTVNFDYQLIDAGDHVVGLIYQRLRGRATGIELPVRYVQVITFRDGLITRLKLYPRKHDAFRAAGLRE